MPKNYNDLTAPFEGGNQEWNTEEANINTEDYNDQTLDTQNPPPGSGDEWNTEM